MITQIRIPINENNKQNTYNVRYKKLTPNAKRILRTMVALYNRKGSSRFSINDFRGSGFGDWRSVSGLFYELESREFGKVGPGHLGPEFSVFAPVLQSIG